MRLVIPVTDLVKSKTVWAGLLSAIAFVLGADAITIEVLLQAIGMLLAAIGVKDAIAKNGQ